MPEVILLVMDIGLWETILTKTCNRLFNGKGTTEFNHYITFMDMPLEISKYSDTRPPFVTPDPSVLLPDLPSLKDELVVLISR